MSDTDSFIDEVNDEVRRDKLYAALRRYGWIGALAVVAIVGGAAFTEYRKAQVRADAQATGDAMLAALALEDPAARSDALLEAPVATPGGDAVARFLGAGEAQTAGDTQAAVASLDAIATNGELPEIYRAVASFKSLVLQTGTLDTDTRRQGFEALATPGAPLSLLAQEQLALIDIAEGDRDAALARYEAIVADAGVSQDLQQRALQVIVALGGEPDLNALARGGQFQQ